MWTVGLIVTNPIARSLTFRFREQPEDREIFLLMEREHAIAASVTPPPKGEHDGNAVPSD